VGWRRAELGKMWPKTELDPTLGRDRLMPKLLVSDMVLPTDLGYWRWHFMRKASRRFMSAASIVHVFRHRRTKYSLR